MKWRVLLGLLAAVTLLGSSKVESKKEYPYRWVRVGSSLGSEQEVERIRKIAQAASEHKLNGIVLSAGLDTLDLKPPEYHRRLREVKEFCAKYHLDIIPSFMSAGYGGAVLSHDKNLAAGLPVKDALFVVKQGEARLLPDPQATLANGGFENRISGQPEGFSLAGKLGETLFIDDQVFKEGKASVRLQPVGQDPEASIGVSQEVSVRPYRCYRLSCWIKSENLKSSDPFGSSNFQLEVYGGTDGRRLQFENPKHSPTQDWHKVTVGFNTWGYDQVRIAPSLSGGGSGKFWLDGLSLEEIGLVNVLRRPGTPLVVRGEKKGTVYVENRDFAAVMDPAMDFHFDHKGPAIRLLPGSRIKEGERLRVSYYHGTFIYNDQTPICMSEPKLYEIWRTQARLVHQALAPKYYLLNMDELRTGGSCEACKKRHMTMGQILGDTLAKQFNLLREVNPKAEILVWSDMLDPNHNANPDRKWYYLSEGTYTDSWKYIPKDLIIVCWYYEKRVPSLRHFSSLGFHTMAGAYYDADDLENPKGWLDEMDKTPGASGIMYTTWLNKYDLLGAFGDLIESHSLGK